MSGQLAITRFGGGDDFDVGIAAVRDGIADLTGFAIGDAAADFLLWGARAISTHITGDAIGAFGVFGACALARARVLALVGETVGNGARVGNACTGAVADLAAVRNAVDANGLAAVRAVRWQFTRAELVAFAGEAARLGGICGARSAAANAIGTEARRALVVVTACSAERDFGLAHPIGAIGARDTIVLTRA